MRLKAKDKTSDTTTKKVPDLNDTTYMGVLESESDRIRYTRKKQNVRVTPLEIWHKIRPTLKENVTNGYSKYLYGGFWRRFFAYAIDFIIVLAIQNAIMGLIDFSLNQPLNTLSVPIFYAINQLLLITYYTLSSYFMNGQTLGKHVLDLQVVHNKEEKLRFSTCFIREGLGKIILTTVPIIGITVLFAPKRENLIDFFTDTNVVSLKQFMFLYEENQI